MRMYVFRPSENQIEAYTYSPDLGTFETDADSQFVLDYNMADLGGFEEIGSETRGLGFDGIGHLAEPSAGTRLRVVRRIR